VADPIRDFLQNEDGDLAVVNGDFATVGGPDAVPQGIRIRVRSQFGEMYLDGAQGVDWQGSILVKGANPVVVRELIREAIVDTPDVTAAVGTQVQITADRQGSVSYTAATVYSSDPTIGEVEVN